MKSPFIRVVRAARWRSCHNGLGWFSQTVELRNWMPISRRRMDISDSYRSHTTPRWSTREFRKSTAFQCADSASGKERWRSTTHPGRVRFVRFSPNRRSLSRSTTETTFLVFGTWGQASCCTSWILGMGYKPRSGRVPLPFPHWGLNWRRPERMGEFGFGTSKPANGSKHRGHGRAVSARYLSPDGSQLTSASSGWDLYQTGPELLFDPLDFNRDATTGIGDIDRLCGELYENSDGRRIEPTQRAISSLGVSSMFAADLDGDGDVDVLGASWEGDTIFWHPNVDGMGTFGEQLVVTNDAISVASMHAADVDGDGDLDVLSASVGDGKIAWYENTDGQATFGGQQVIASAARNAKSVYAADVDGDGDVDVLAATA